MKEKILRFGEISPKGLITILFYTGILPIIYKSFTYGKTVYLNNFVQKMVKQGEWFTSEEINNLPLAIFQGVIVFLVSIIIWKVVCEIVYIIIRFFDIKSKE